MENNKYYKLTLNSGVGQIELENKIIPIIGTINDLGEMVEIISNEKIDINLDKKPTELLSILYYRELPVKESRTIDRIISNLTDEEKSSYIDELNMMKQKVKDQHYINSACGLGDKLHRKLKVKSQNQNNN